MKKIRNRIIALMLSVIMMFGFIPCNIASAEEITETGTDWAILSKYLDTTKVPGLEEYTIVKNSNGDELFDVEDVYYLRFITLRSDIKGSDSDGDVALNVKTSDLINFDLNGHILDRGLIAPDGTITKNNNGSVINLMSGALCIYDYSNPETNLHYLKEVEGLWIPTSGPGDDTVEIKGGIITGGTGTKIGDYYRGGAIYISGNGAALDINGGNICGNTATNGGAISVSDLSVEVNLKGGDISYNKASCGGALYFYSDTNEVEFVLKKGSISNNTATFHGGGIYNAGSGQISITGGSISNNTAAIDGGGIYNSNSGQISLENGSISNNTAEYGGGIYSDEGTINLVSGSIEDNTATEKGSAMNVIKGTLNSEQKDINVTGSIICTINSEPKTYYLVNVDSNYMGKITSSPAVGENGTEVTINSTVPYAYLTVDDEKINGNKFTLGNKSVILSLVEPQPSTSKKYKTNILNNQDIKILGSGKKGSKRTIVITNNKKVQSILVKDKNDNEIEVTKNEDGTYTFIQPSSDVYVDVTFKNRVITLNIGSTKAMVDGEESNLDVCPILRNDRTMLPIRFIAENLGATVTWDEKNPNYVLITRGDTKIEITLESDIMKVNGKDVKLDQVAFAENDRTYLPVRAISEALNAVVEWDESKPSIVNIYER